MSTWYELKDPDDIDYNNETDAFDIYVTDVMKLNDSFGATYLSIPAKFIRDLLKEKQ